MPEDYLTKSGAKDLITTAISEVLTLRPRVPVAFLASYFQGLATNTSARTVTYLRACHPSSPSFPSTVEKVFHELAATEASTASNNNNVDSLPLRSESAPRKVRTGGPATISLSAFSQLLLQLSEDFPKAVQSRFLQQMSTMGSENVSFARFQRGVHACLLLEELLDAATLLFQAIEANESTGTISADTLTTTLRSAATTQFPRDIATVLTSLLSNSLAPNTTLPSHRPVLHLSDVHEIVFGLAFTQ